MASKPSVSPVLCGLTIEQRSGRGGFAALRGMGICGIITAMRNLREDRANIRTFGAAGLIAYVVGACFLLVLAFATVNAISIKDGMLINEERSFWRLKSSVRVPVSEIEGVYVSDGESWKYVVICCRDAIASKYWFRMSWLSSLWNRADRIRDSIECSVRDHKDLETITEYRASENFLLAGIFAVIGVAHFLGSLRKSRKA